MKDFQKHDLFLIGCPILAVLGAYMLGKEPFTIGSFVIGLAIGFAMSWGICHKLINHCHPKEKENLLRGT